MPINTSDLASRAGSFRAGRVVATRDHWHPTDVVERVGQVHVQVYQPPSCGVAQHDRAATCGAMLEQLFNKRAQEAVVVLNAWRENSVQANVRHLTAQAAGKVEYLGGYRGVGNPFLHLSAVRCDREV